MCFLIKHINYTLRCFEYSDLSVAHQSLSKAEEVRTLRPEELQEATKDPEACGTVLVVTVTGWGSATRCDFIIVLRCQCSFVKNSI